MRRKSLALSTLSALFLLLALTASAFAEDDRALDDDDGYEETARVARVSLIRGDVSLRRADSDKWERAALNVPLVEGDRLATGADARLEIQIDARNFVRVGEYATLEVVTLRDEGVALSLVEGTATLKLARFQKEREYFEIDAPGTTVAAERAGLYRLDVTKDGGVRVTVRADGRARVYSQDSGFTLRAGRTAELAARGGAGEMDWELADARSFDAWDTWVDERDRHLASRLRYEGRDRYYDDSVWGAEELDAYGDWVETRDYGYVWRPHSTVISHYSDWAPYRYGSWVWVAPYGWTWVGDEPWGWAPYHYGRWVYVNNYWCWAPRGYVGYRRRSWWRPALVAFVYVPSSYGENICWYPLSYHRRDPHSNWWRRALGRDRRRHYDEIAKFRTSPIQHRAVTKMPARDFGKGTARGKAAEDELARKAVSGEPVFGKLPVRPVDDGRGPGGGRAGERGVIARGATGANDGAPRRLAERPTGAGARRPGVALDEELRRSRVFNNREPVFAKGAKGSPVDSAGGDGSAAGRDGSTRGVSAGRSTGAVARPSRPPVTPGDGGERGGGIGDAKSNGSRRVRPGRPDDDASQTNTDSDDKRSGPGRTRPSERDKGGDDNDRPSRPVFRSEPKEERRASPPQREERREPQREHRPEPRYERPAPREERQAPPQREERRAPPPREERQSSPPPREERRAPPPKEEKRGDPPRESHRPSRDKSGRGN